jgi:hypothetical protein
LQWQKSIGLEGGFSPDFSRISAGFCCASFWVTLFIISRARYNSIRQLVFPHPLRESCASMRRRHADVVSFRRFSGRWLP